MNLHLLMAKLAGPIVWRIPGHSARKLFEFALAEQGSMLDLSAAARNTSSESRQALYIKHLLDERRHARMFAHRSAELCQQAGRPTYGSPHADIDHLFEMLGEVRFLAFVHLGEGKACQQFTVYRDWFKRYGDQRTQSLFDAILKDEQRHESYTWELLVQMTGDEQAAHAEVRRARAWEAWRTWRRAGRTLANKLFNLLSLGVYILMAPYAVVTQLVRPYRKGWLVPIREQELDSGGRKLLDPSPGLSPGAESQRTLRGD